MSHADILSPLQAFLGICDVLMAHSYQTNVWDPTSFGPLLYTPSPKLQRALSTFVCCHVFVAQQCDSQSRGEALGKPLNHFIGKLTLGKRVLLKTA